MTYQKNKQPASHVDAGKVAVMNNVSGFPLVQSYYVSASDVWSNVFLHWGRDRHIGVTELGRHWFM